MRWTALIAILALAALLLGSACAGTQPPPATPTPTPGLRQVAVGQEFTLKAGEPAEVAAAEFVLNFSGVPQDSRCPRDVVCVRAGSVTVEVQARASNGQPAALKLTLGDEGSPSAQFDIYTVTLRAVDPYPVSTQTIDPMDYEATLIVEGGSK